MTMTRFQAIFLAEGMALEVVDLLCRPHCTPRPNAIRMTKMTI